MCIELLCVVFQGFVERSKGNLFHLKDKVQNVEYTCTYSCGFQKVLVCDTKEQIFQYYCNFDVVLSVVSLRASFSVAVEYL